MVGWLVGGQPVAGRGGTSNDTHYDGSRDIATSEARPGRRRTAATTLVVANVEAHTHTRAGGRKDEISRLLGHSLVSVALSGGHEPGRVDEVDELECVACAGAVARLEARHQLRELL